MRNKFENGKLILLKTFINIPYQFLFALLFNRNKLEKTYRVKFEELVAKKEDTQRISKEFERKLLLKEVGFYY